MLYPNHIEEKLGFDKIRSLLIEKCESALGMHQLSKLKFCTDYDQILIKLRQTNEFKKILTSPDQMPSSNYYDVSEYLKKASIAGNFLEEDEIWEILKLINTHKKCSKFINKRKEDLPELFKFHTGKEYPAELEKELAPYYTDEGKIKDKASPELFKIRKNLREETANLRKTLNKIFKDAGDKGYIPDGSTVTVKGGRLVLPILAEHKRKIKGYIQDQSATGQTVYLEPEATVEISNHIKELEYLERKELIKILTKLTALINQNSEFLKDSMVFLGIIDLTRAKARLAGQTDSHLPDFKKKQILHLKKARHPILFLSYKDNEKEVVPLDIQLRKENRFLLISGPNAGGKSVALKTVGLIQYMVQCGLLVPVNEDSEMGLFQNIFIDIGDEQSIENDLSTYSSHLNNMNFALGNGNENTLLLIDEFGSGTEPIMGGAIAESILKEFLDLKMWGVITTHYMNLKKFAEKTAGIQNGAMLFDSENLKPFYTLEIGRPGSSFALEIASKIGLPKRILFHAKDIMGEEFVDFERLLHKIEQDKMEILTKKELIESQEKTSQTMINKYKKLLQELEDSKKEILRQAKQEAERMITEANREIEKTIKEIREKKAEKKSTKKVRKNLEDYQKRFKEDKKSATPLKNERKEKIIKGDFVKIVDGDVSGEVLQIKGDQAEVRFGNLKSTVKLSRLIKVSDQKDVKKDTGPLGHSLDFNKKTAEFSNTLDLRGKRASEALNDMEKFLDDSLLIGRDEVKIMHGKGEGILRKVLRDHLKKLDYVSSFRDEEIESGGAGITVVSLK